MTSKDKFLRIAVVGGTGKEGSGLAARWAHAGYSVVIGSREKEKADRASAKVNELLGNDYVRGETNADAAEQADIAVLTVPYGAHKPILESVQEQVQGKILVDVTVPIEGAIDEVYLPKGRSAAEEAQALLGENVRVVGAFHHISHTHLKDVTHIIDSDVLVCGDDDEAKKEVLALVTAAGLRGIDAGKLVNAVALEAFTPVLVAINKRYKVKGAGLKIAGLPPL